MVPGVSLRIKVYLNRARAQASLRNDAGEGRLQTRSKRFRSRVQITEDRATVQGY
jgi:hypothetical protein